MFVGEILGVFSRFVTQGSLVRSGRFSTFVTKGSLVRSGRFSTFVTKVRW
jgi:hypothetical protein